MLRNIICILVVILLITCNIEVVLASDSTQSTSYTYTYSINGKLEIAQDAYLPTMLYLDLGLKEPQDLYIYDNKMYIADKGNKRVVVVNVDTSEVKSIGEGILEEPVGVSVDKDGRIYVADFKKSVVYRFNKDGALEFTFERPKTPNFGKNESFKPKKIAHADDGGVYIVSEGTTAGIIHLSGNGDFLGYFASNEVYVSIFQKLQDLFLTEAQKRVFLRRTPPAFGNIFRGYDGLVYTVNKGSGVNVKKHSINGLNMLKRTKTSIKLEDPADLYVCEDGRIYVLQGNGLVTELTNEGNLICTFGGNSEKTDRVGLFEVPRGIAVDKNDNVYVLDEQKGLIQVFTPTLIQLNIHKAIETYNNGLYSESKKLWEEVLRFNNTSFLAHLYMGRIYMQEMNYSKALEHFKIAGVKDEYSAAFWEIRYIWLQEHLGKVLVMFLCLFIVGNIIKVINKRRNLFGFVKALKEKMLRHKLIFDIVNLKYAMYHPIDNAYDVKIGKRGSILSATIIYIMLFILLVLKQTASGYIFSVDVMEYSIINTLIAYVLIVGLFIVCNYLVGSIHDGNGTLRSLYIGTAYSFAPAIMLMPFVILLSNVATINESFFISGVTDIIICWCVVNILLMIAEIHEYEFSMAISNALITLFFMAVVILAGSMFYLFLRQVWNFVVELVMEVLIRAKTY